MITAVQASPVAVYVTALDENSPSMLGSTLTDQSDIAALSSGGYLHIGCADDNTRLSFGGSLDEVRYTIPQVSSILNPFRVYQPRTRHLMCLKSERLPLMVI